MSIQKEVVVAPRNELDDMEQTWGFYLIGNFATRYFVNHGRYLDLVYISYMVVNGSSLNSR